MGTEDEMARRRTGPVLLAILDGWGDAAPGPGNAVSLAKTPVMDRLLATYPHTQLHTSGESVGLPDGQMGNSEVGHLNLGAGFIVYQWLTRLDREARDGGFARNPALREAMDAAAASGTRLHLVGLVSDGGVHSHQCHLIALLEMAHNLGLRGSQVLVHAITDGRDTAPDSAAGFLATVQAAMDRIGTGVFATVEGRYFAMDRDRRWERTTQAFNAIVHGEAPAAASAGAAVAASQAAGVTDEFVEPRVLPVDGAPYGGMRNGDQVIWFNFRSDRARQLTQAMVEPAFDGFDRGTLPTISVTTMTPYQEGLPVAVAYREDEVAEPLAAVVSHAGLKQFHAAETEKYAHVTYFINGGREEPFPGEDRQMVPSLHVATYDLQPEMSALPLTDVVLTAINDGDYALIVVNFANGDMVGHTGVIPAVVKAIETVDTCLGRLVEAVLGKHGALVITADHGNAEKMVNSATGGPLTSHTTNPVPLLVVAPDDDPDRHLRLRGGGVLSAVAPTVLDLIGLTPPPAMTQHTLIEHPAAGHRGA